MQRQEWTIYNGTLKTLIWSKMWMISSYFWLKKCLFLSIHTHDQTKLLNRCKSGITIFAWRLTWNYAYSPFNIFNLSNMQIKLNQILKGGIALGSVLQINSLEIQSFFTIIYYLFFSLFLIYLKSNTYENGKCKRNQWYDQSNKYQRSTYIKVLLIKSTVFLTMRQKCYN